MTNKEWIKILQGLQDWLYLCSMNGGARLQREAIDKAIEALSKPETHWIPCSEGLPEKEGYFLVTVSCMGVIYVDARYYYVERDSSHWGNYESGSVIAWMTLPAPYQPQKEVTE